MWTQLGTPAGFSLLAIGAACLGALALAIRPDWVRRHAALFSTAAAGLLLAFVLLDLMPHALEGGELAAPLLLAGFLGGAVTALLFGHHHRGACITPHFERALVPLLGLSLHALLDGVVFAVSHAESERSAILAASALVLHKVPVAALCFGFLRTAGIGTGTSITLTVSTVGGMSMIGALGSAPIFALLGTAGVSALFALSAGLLLYVACGPLLTAATDLPRKRAAGAVMTGAALAFAIVIAVPHDHGAHDHEDTDLATAHTGNPLDPAGIHGPDDGHDH
jgi:zinc and cadmium transporter